MRNLSLVSVVVAIFISILGCADGLDVSAGANVGYGVCDTYGQVCSGESYEAGAFEVVIMPYATDVYGVTVTVTFVDAANGEDVVQTSDLYPGYDGEYWFYSPGAPPEGKVEVQATVYLQYDYGVQGLCDRDPQADMYAYNNGWEVDVDYRYSSDTCFAQADLRDIVD